LLEYAEVNLTPDPIKFVVRTEADCLGVGNDPRGIAGFQSLIYKDGGFSNIPEYFFESWRNYCKTPGILYIGRCSSFGVGSSIRFSEPDEIVRVGRYVSAGIETRLMCSGFHETRAISTCEFGSYDKDINHGMQRKFPEILIKNDIWIGDDCMIMPDSIINDGCVIGARSLIPLHFRSEPYGVYAGHPAKLIKFRFSEKIREALVDISWWDKPFKWVKENNKYFILDLTADEGYSLEMLKELKNAG
jgi:acetyltransferase-like isoleucine patch superfamily enzyme